MTLIERLRDPLSSDNWLTDRRDAADEIERSHKELNQKAAYIAKLEDEVERLTACVEHHQAVEADQERAIEWLQSELGVWKANAETNLGEVERLQMLYEGEVENRLNIAKSHDLQTAEIERLMQELAYLEATDEA